MNSGLKVRLGRGLLQESGQRCWGPKFNHKLWRLDWKYVNDIKEPEMRVCWPWDEKGRRISVGNELGAGAWRYQKDTGKEQC